MGTSKECREILRRICGEVGKPVDSAFCQRVARHLEECPACRAQAASLRGTLELYRCLEAQEVPEEIAQDLREKLGLGTPQERSSSS
jgi:predicted anti-sigma-YlaC factor YlaD